MLCHWSRRHQNKPDDHRHAVPLFSYIVTLCLLSGCVADQQAIQATKMRDALTPYIGRSIADYVVDRGPPTTTVDLGGNKRAFQWQISGQTAGAVVPISGALIAVPPRQQTCMVSLVASARKQSPALSDWIIEDWRWNGAC
jgi:hypothetical protein